MRGGKIAGDRREVFWCWRRMHRCLLVVLAAAAAAGAGAQRGVMLERPRLVGFAVTPTHPRVGQWITFTFVVRNNGRGSLFPGSPPPRTLYTQGQTYRQKRGPGPRGSYRVAVGWRGSGGNYPFRWGLAESIYGGRTDTITVRARMRRPGTYRFYGRLERVGYGLVGSLKVAPVEVRPATRRRSR